MTHKKAKPNLEFIREHGLERFMEQQRKRIVLLERMLKDFDDGRSRSFYCIASILLPIADKTEQRLKAHNTNLDDNRIESKVLREFLSESATRNMIDLRLRKKGDIW